MNYLSISHFEKKFMLQTNFATPEGNNPVAIKMERMGKGVVWVNGNNLGRYWENYRSPLGAPSQTE